ncbi:MAG: type IV pilus modification protein PilV [Proteobacteria bacterium]|nr:type IV pilus modification protein PilV [Pseudomonadota bacterium]
MQFTKPTSTARAKKTISGFTLVEVLIALVILSIGMLGIAGLYVHSMKAGRTSVFRHHAVTLAGDVADRIRANPRAGAVYGLAGANNNCVAGGVNCTAAQMAGNDIFLWDQQATDTLPDGTVTVVFSIGIGGAPPTYEITVAWTEPGENMTYIITIPVRGI